LPFLIHCVWARITKKLSPHGNGFAAKQRAPPVQLLDHRRVEIIQLLARTHSSGSWGTARPGSSRTLSPRNGSFPHILLRRLAFALLLVGATSTGSNASSQSSPFEPPPPIPALAPAGQPGGRGHRHSKSAHLRWASHNKFTSVEMNVGLQHISVGLGSDRFSRSVFFFLNTARPACTTTR